MHVHKAIAALPGVESVEVYLAAEKAVVSLDTDRVDLQAISTAVERAGYSVPEEGSVKEEPWRDFTRPILKLLGVVFGVVIFSAVVGEWMGLYEKVTDILPWWISAVIVLLVGYPVFRNVLRATLRGQVTSHTLMTVGVIAALLAGEWTTAVLVAFFMRVGLCEAFHHRKGAAGRSEAFNRNGAPNRAR